MNPRPPGYEPDELPNCSTPRYKDVGAGDRDRTGTGSLPRDFKSRASASSATPAYRISQALYQDTTYHNACQEEISSFLMRRKNTAPATTFCASRGASAGAKRLWNIEIKNRGQFQRRYFSHSKGEWVSVTLFSAFVMFRAPWGGVEDEECLRRGLAMLTGGSRPPGR